MWWITRVNSLEKQNDDFLTFFFVILNLMAGWFYFYLFYCFGKSYLECYKEIAIWIVIGTWSPFIFLKLYYGEK